MKKLLLIALLALSSIIGYAQLPKWVIPSANDTIFVKMENSILQSETNGQSTLWTMDGKQLYSTDQTILPFKDGVATILQKDNNAIIGFVDSTGKFTSLPFLTVAFDNPYFENGFLPYLGKNGYGFYTKEGAKAIYPASVIAYPFHYGYSPYLTYDQMEKRKDPHYAYQKSDGSQMQYSIVTDKDSKTVDARNIEFLSGIGTDGTGTNKGVAVIKNKLYWFMAETETFEPLLWGSEESEKKRHLNLLDDYEEYFLNLPSDTVVIRAKYGKNQIATLKFDKELRPTVFTFDTDAPLTFTDSQPKAFEYRSELSSLGSGPYGLNHQSNEWLPAQFERIGLMYGNKAIVKTGGKWGVIEIIPDITYSIRINKGEDIAFRHQRYETQIRLDLPAIISAKDLRIAIPDSTGCIIDKTSREVKDTEDGNFVTYNCILTIPDSFPDTTIPIHYAPIELSYEGITLPQSSCKVNARYIKHYNVDPIESETSISNGVASFTINIDEGRIIGEKDYPFNVEITADSIIVVSEKLSETRRKYTVSNLQEGLNRLDIIVAETGCPASIFPFEIYYTKPIPKKKQKEEIIVRKNSAQSSKQPIRIEL